jgi:chitodextrinase
MLPYPSFNGTVADSYPTSYYAFTTGGTRFYMLDAAWSNSNVGQATGGACGTSTSCKIYEVDAAAHWTAASDQYTWLAADLAAHPSERKLAFFHFPLRSDDNNQPGDTFLQNAAGSSGSLEQLLRDGGVRLAFNGHSHTYQRFVPPPGGLASYVTGGGGALATTVGDKGCSSLNAYGIGWTYGSNKGKACGAAVASPPTSDAQVYHYLKVSLSGTRATVTPISSAGQAFDPVTYELGPDSTPPSAPGSLAFTRPTTTSVALTWTPASDAGGVVAYDVYRDGARLTTLPATKTAYTDTTAAAGGQYTYRVDARDLAGNVGPASVAVGGPGPDTSAPSAPASLTSTAQSPTSVALSWTASSDNVAVTGYTITRNGVAVATTAGTVTSYSDTTVAPSTTYAYTVKASDAAGNVSNASPTASATTPPALPPPTTLFADDFESNGLTAWTANSGLTTVGTGAHTGTFAARASSAGTATSAYKTLPSTYTELWGQAWFNVTSKSTSVNLVGFNRATGANILVAYLDASNRVSVRNNAGLVTTNSTTTVAPGSWHRLVLHAVVNGTTSSFDVALDGVPVPGLTLTGQNLGTSAIGRLQLGDTSTARTYDVLLDDVVASSTSF